MTEALAAIGVVLIAFMILVFGGVIQDSKRDDRCKSGAPQVIEAKVYRCVESK